MNKNDIIRMAREAGLGNSLSHNGGDKRVWIEGADWHDEVERFAALVAAATREACAKVCDERERANLYGFKECAAAIRARGNTGIKWEVEP